MPFEGTEHRKLAAIMFTDMVGYSALSQRDGKLALELLEEHRQLLREIFPRFNGTEIKTIGDAFLVEFNSALEAAQCGIEIQRGLAKRNADAQAERQIEIRIGIHIGDVIHRAGDVYGDGVNIASRIEQVANAGGICVSMDVERQIRNALKARFEKLAPTELKNISVPMDLFRIVLPWERPSTRVTKTQAPRKSTSRRFLPIAIGLVLLLLIGVGWWRTAQPRRYPASSAPLGAAAVPEKSIAVLPFENHSRDPDNAYFADGIQDEILTRLSKIADLKVISHTSTQDYKSAPGNLPEIARQLGVAHILEGSVQKSGDAVRVNVQLIKAANDSHLWADTFDRKLTDIFSVESEIAKAIADQLRAKLTGQEEQVIAARPTESSEAHQLYLRGRYFWNKRTSDGLKTSIYYFNQAIEKDPVYGPAYAGLADAYAVLPNYSQTPGKEAYPKAEAAALKALEIDDKLSEAHIALANVRIWHKWARDAEPEFKRGLDLNPNYSTGHQWYSIYLSVVGRYDEAIAEMEKAKKLDPFSIIISTEEGCPYLYSKRYDRAAECFSKAVEMDPDFPFAHFALAEAYDRAGRLSEAWAEHGKAIDLAHRGHAFDLAGGDVPRAWYALTGPLQNAYSAFRGITYWRDRLESEKQSYEQGNATATGLAGIYAILGDKDQALTWLAKAYEQSDDFLVFVNIQPQFDKLHSDSRFQAVINKVFQRLDGEKPQ